MKKPFFLFLLSVALSIITVTASAQCSICTRTVAQMGEKPAQGLNSGILYLALTPFIVVGLIGYRWWKNNREKLDQSVSA